MFDRDEWNETNNEIEISTKGGLIVKVRGCLGMLAHLARCFTETNVQ